MGLMDDVKTVGSGIAGVAKGVVNVERGIGAGAADVVGTVASGVSRVAADVASAAHKVSTYARGSENHAGSAPNTPNHQGVSHAPNAGPEMRKHMTATPRPYRSELVTGGDGKTQIQTRDTKTGGVIGGYGYGVLK